MVQNLKKIESEKDKQEDYLKELKWRELQNNLQFFNIQDSKEEKWEECLAEVMEMLERNMEIENAGDRVQIELVERFGWFSDYSVKNYKSTGSEIQTTTSPCFTFCNCVQIGKICWYVEQET